MKIKCQLHDLFSAVPLFVETGRVFAVGVGKEEVFEVVLSPKARNSSSRAIVLSVFFQSAVLH